MVLQSPVSNNLSRTVAGTPKLLSGSLLFSGLGVTERVPVLGVRASCLGLRVVI